MLNQEEDPKRRNKIIGHKPKEELNEFKSRFFNNLCIGILLLGCFHVFSISNKGIRTKLRSDNLGWGISILILSCINLKKYNELLQSKMLLIKQF